MAEQRIDTERRLDAVEGGLRDLTFKVDNLRLFEREIRTLARVGLVLVPIATAALVALVNHWLLR